MAYFLSVFEEVNGSEAIVKNEIIMYSILFLKTNISNAEDLTLVWWSTCELTWIDHIFNTLNHWIFFFNIVDYLYIHFHDLTLFRV